MSIVIEHLEFLFCTSYLHCYLNISSGVLDSLFLNGNLKTKYSLISINCHSSFINQLVICVGRRSKKDIVSEYIIPIMAIFSLSSAMADLLQDEEIKTADYTFSCRGK